jgi:hypothetical protein
MSLAPLYRAALTLNADAYRATTACEHGESDWRVIEIRQLGVALVPIAQRVTTRVSLEDVAGLRSGLAQLVELVEEARERLLITPTVAEALVADAAELSRALSAITRG